MITTVNQASSASFDNKLVRKSLHNETYFNKCEFTEKCHEFINLTKHCTPAKAGDVK